MKIDPTKKQFAIPVVFAAGIAVFACEVFASESASIESPASQVVEPVAGGVSVAVEMRPRTELESARVSLGEIAMCVPARTEGVTCEELMAVDIEASPFPGKTGRISRAAVSAILADEFPGARVEVLGAETAFVTAKSYLLTDDMLTEPFRAQMDELFSSVEGIRLEVTSLRIENRPRIRPGSVACEFAQLEFIKKRLDDPSGTSISGDLESLLTRVQNGARFNAKCTQGESDSGIFVQFMPRFSVERQLPVARQDLPAKATFRATDATLAWVPWLRSTANAVRDASTVAGMLVVRPVRAGQPLMLRDFERPVAVRRGDHVRLIQKSGDLTITGNAVAVSQGAVGENIDVQTVATKKRIRGVIRGNGLVEAM